MPVIFVGMMPFDDQLMLMQSQADRTGTSALNGFHDFAIPHAWARVERVLEAEMGYAEPLHFLPSLRMTGVEGVSQKVAFRQGGLWHFR